MATKKKSPALRPGSIGQRWASGQPPYKPFTPYAPPPLPSGSYDPALDAQLGAANRGLGDLQGDAATNAQRLQNDYGLQQDQINLGASRGRADYQQQLDRGLADYQTSFDRGSQDYQSQVGLLQRSYQQLQNRQAQDAAASGVRGGAALQAAAKRAANMAIDRNPLDTAWQRAQQDIATGRDRLTTDVGTGMSRLTQDSSNQLGALGLQFQRQSTDASTALSRAEREGSQFGIDVQAQKAFQAAQSGYVAPAAPKNQGVGPLGNPYKIVRQGAYDVYVRPNGTVAKRVKRK